MTPEQDEILWDFINGSDLMKRFVDDFCLTIIDMSHPIGAVILRM